MKRPASTGGYQSAKRAKASGIKCFFKPKSSATPSLSTTESPSSGRASAVPDPLQVPDNPTVPDPPLPTPESPSSARASAVPDPIQVPDDPTVPDPPLPTPESPSSARASEVPDPNQVPDDSTVPDPPLPTPESPSSARASEVPDPNQVSDDSTAPDPEVTTLASVEEISESPYHPDPKLIPLKKTATQNIYFQRKWFGEYPWLSYNSTIGGVICHIMFNRVLFNYLNTYLII